MLNQLRVSIGQPITEDIGLNLGLTYNVSVASYNSDPYNLGPDIQPFWKSTMFTLSSTEHTTVRNWLGFSFGLSF